MALTNAERQRKHRQNITARLKKISINPLYTYIELLDDYLDKFTPVDYQEILDFGLLHFDPDFVSGFDGDERHLLLTAIKIACRERLAQGLPND